MSCKGCSQVGDCACAVVGDGDIISVTGTGGALDPYTIVFDTTEMMDAVATATPAGGETWTILARKSDGTVRRIPAAGCCAVLL